MYQLKNIPYQKSVIIVMLGTIFPIEIVYIDIKYTNTYTTNDKTNAFLVSLKI
jgi:hypothetical protein